MTEQNQQQIPSSMISVTKDELNAMIDEAVERRMSEASNPFKTTTAAQLVDVSKWPTATFDERESMAELHSGLTQRFHDWIGSIRDFYWMTRGSHTLSHDAIAKMIGCERSHHIGRILRGDIYQEAPGLTARPL